MKRNYLFLLLIPIVFSGCSIIDRTMQTPNYHIEYYKADFEYSQQVNAEATVVRVFCVDWSRLFKWNSATISNSTEGSSAGTGISIGASIPIDPIVGILSTVIPVFGDKAKGTANTYALYSLMAENPGYDVVIYPQYETKKFIIPFIYSKRTAKVTARLAKIK